ncbi:MAG: thioesterase [Actinobacteria bacterium]|nr:thioesterase [Actinomycetota bacterium]
MPLAPGLVGTVTATVASEDTAEVLGSGDVPVLATPRVALFAEQATVAAIEGHIPEGSTTVGYRVQLDHLAPVPIGDEVTTEAVLETVEGRRLTFRVSVKCRDGLVAAGRVTRVVVERARFLEKATRRS